MSTASLQPEWQRYVEWITVLSQNLMAAANDLRPVQVCFRFFVLKEAKVSNSTYLGTSELGNDDDKTTRVTTGGNETVALVRGFSNNARPSLQTSNRTHEQKVR